MITLGHEFCKAVHNTDGLKNHVCPNLQTNMRNKYWLCEGPV